MDVSHFLQDVLQRESIEREGNGILGLGCQLAV